VACGISSLAYFNIVNCCFQFRTHVNLRLLFNVKNLTGLQGKLARAILAKASKAWAATAAPSVPRVKTVSPPLSNATDEHDGSLDSFTSQQRIDTGPTSRSRYHICAPCVGVIGTPKSKLCSSS